MFSQGLFVVLTPPICLVVILYLLVRRMTSPKSVRGFTKFCLFLNVFNLIVFLLCFLVCKSELTKIAFSWEQQLNIINQVTWSSVWPWYNHVLSKLCHTYEWYMFWIVVVVFSLVCDGIYLKGQKKQTEFDG